MFNEEMFNDWSTINHYRYIVYACPTGELNKQIEEYFKEAIKLCGKNKAHQYMPHCTLTGFFTDELNSVPFYLEALDKAYTEAKNNTSLDIEIISITFNDSWHGLELQGDNIKQLIANFAELENSPTRQEPIRLKDWLHLSLAYGFNSQNTKQLKHLATELIDIQANVNWELRFYQKNPDWTWKCWQSWEI